MKLRKYICPACRQKTGVDILYGHPSYEAFEMAERGEVALGGGGIDLEGPERKCTACEREWRITRQETKFA
ncbi:hypothetical protein E4Q23_22655 [Candidatus Accumulibacter phosphatis]|uniref:Hemagglutinin n=1 Tax=Candidatus Accumulibacter phosphatis TaxID=327160 RepID=A0ABX1U5J6_9PROT|nr:hypothetical protein [Candidatus Accumulibacter phosphatis]NMQ30310.1 hypothetical protein [Candidatus Accumulibacter phosphatis]